MLPAVWFRHLRQYCTAWLSTQSHWAGNNALILAAFSAPINSPGWQWPRPSYSPSNSKHHCLSACLPFNSTDILGKIWGIRASWHVCSQAWEAPCHPKSNCVCFIFLFLLIYLFILHIRVFSPLATPVIRHCVVFAVPFRIQSQGETKTAVKWGHSSPINNHTQNDIGIISTHWVHSLLVFTVYICLSDSICFTYRTQSVYTCTL